MHMYISAFSGSGYTLIYLPPPYLLSKGCNVDRVELYDRELLRNLVPLTSVTDNNYAWIHAWNL